MKAAFLERLDLFHAAPFTVQRICELLTDPRKQYSRIDKFMRAIEKNLLVVSTIEPGRDSDNNSSVDALESALNGDLSSESIEESDEMKIDDEEENEKNDDKELKDLEGDDADDESECKKKSDIVGEKKETTENGIDEKTCDKMDETDCKKVISDENNKKSKDRCDVDSTITDDKSTNKTENVDKKLYETKDEAIASTSEFKSDAKSPSPSSSSIHTPVASGSKSTDTEMSETDTDFLEKIKIVEEKLTSYLDCKNKSNASKMPTDLLENCLMEFEKAQKIDQRIIPILTKIAQHASIANQTRTLLSAISLVSHPALTPILRGLNDERLNERLDLLTKNDTKRDEESRKSTTECTPIKSDVSVEKCENKEKEIVIPAKQIIEKDSDSLPTSTTSDNAEKKIDDDISSDSSDSSITPPNETISNPIPNDVLSDIKNIETEENTSSSSSSSSSTSSQDIHIEPTIAPIVDEMKLPSIDTITDDLPIPAALDDVIPQLEPLDDIPVLDALVNEEPTFTSSVSSPILISSTTEPLISELNTLPPIVATIEQHQHDEPHEIPILDEIIQIIPEPLSAAIIEATHDAVLIPEIEPPLITTTTSSVLSPMQDASESSNDTMDTTTNLNEVKMDDDEISSSPSSLASTVVSATSSTDSVLGTSLTELIAKEDIAMDIDESVEPMDQ